MVAELRTRRASAGSQKTATKSKDATPVKRKATEEASPVVTKKTKPLKADGAAKKPAKPSKSATKSEKPAAPVAAEEEDQISDDDQDNDQALALAGVSDSEDDAEIDADVAFKEGQEVGKAPVGEKAAGKAPKASKSGKEEKAVVYVGRIPHGFYERQMHEYFGQFGDITRLRLSRNKKTGQSKHFAFIEFAEESTAEYVVKSMNNYLLFGHLLKCRMVPNSQVHSDLFKGAGKRYKAIPSNKLEANKLRKPLSEDKWAAKVSKENEKRAEKAKKLEALGYEFEAPELKVAVAPAAEALEAGQEEAPKAIEPAPVAAEPEVAADDEIGDGIESLDGDRVTKKPVKASKQNGAKGGKKAKKPVKAKKVKA